MEPFEPPPPAAGASGVPEGSMPVAPPLMPPSSPLMPPSSPPPPPPAPSRLVPPSPWAAPGRAPEPPADAMFSTDGSWTEINLGGPGPDAAGSATTVRRRRLIAAGAAVAVLAGGLASVRLLRSPSGASSSPQAAVEQFIHALEKRDLLGAVETFPKADRELIGEAISSSAKQRFSAAKDIDLHAVPGYKLEITGLQTATDAVTDDIAVVTLTAGHYRASADLGDIYRRAKLDSVADQLPPEILTPSGEGDLNALDQPIQLGAVHDGEGWHVSIPYTIAELVRRDAGLPAPDPAQRIAAKGASSAEDAARSMVNAVTGGDWRRAIELLPSDEAAVLHDYGTLFAHKWLSDAKPWAKVTTLETHTKARGKRTAVVVDKIGVELLADASDALRSFTVARTSSGCFTVTWVGDGDSQTTTGCVDDFSKILSSNTGLPAEWISESKQQLGSLFDNAGVVTIEHDGQWFVSPYHTIASLGVALYLGGVSTLTGLLPGRATDIVGGGSSADLTAGAAQATARAAFSTMRLVRIDAGNYNEIAAGAVHDADPELLGATPDAEADGSQASWVLTGSRGAENGFAVAVRSSDGVCYLIREQDDRTQFGRYDATNTPCHASGSPAAWADNGIDGWK